MRKLALTALALCAALAAGWAIAEVREETPREREGERGREARTPDEERPAADDGTPEAREERPSGQAETREEAGEEEGEQEAPAAQLPEDVAGFVAAMSEQIEAAGGTPRCDEARGRCSYTHRAEGGRSQEIHIWYGEPSRTIYVFAPWLGTAGQDNAATPTVLRHMAAISRRLELARMEWNPTTGEIRMGAVLNVDSNLDRRGLRSLMGAMQADVDRYQPGLSRVLEDHEADHALPAPPAATNDRAVADRHNYMPAIEEELRSLGLSPTCDAAQGRCTYDLDSEQARNVFSVTVQLDTAANTLVVSSDRYMSAPTDNPNTDRLLRRLMELNWEQLVPMFSWDSRAGHVRLAGAMRTESNLDRRAFRGVVTAVHGAAERNYRAMRTVLNP